jgi:GNAT superfamily N-acetyltransferase
VEAARPARAGDLDRLSELARLAQSAVAQARGGELLLATHPRAGGFEDLRAVLECDDQILVVGTIDDYVVGYAAVRLQPLPGGQLLGAVDDLFVEPEARGVGVGEAIMNAVLDWCRARGCTGVDAVALPGDRHTKNFFESFGMVARAITVHRRVDIPMEATPSKDAGGS